MKSLVRVAFCCALLVPSFAFAQSEHANVQSAIEADAAAKELFQAGQFAAAAAEFRRSYELDPLAATLKSEAVSWFKASRCDAAQTVFDEHEAELATLPADEQQDLFVIRTDCAYERAGAHLERDELDAAAKALAAAEANDRIKRRQTELTALRAQIDARRDRKAAEEAEAKAAKQQKAAQAEAARLEAAREASRAHESETAVANGAQTGKGVRWQTVAGWSLIGTGAALLGYQTVINTLVQPAQWTEHEELRAQLSRCSGNECAAKQERADLLFRRLDRWANREEAIWIFGGAFVAGGVATLLLAPKTDTPVTLGPGPGLLGLSVTFRR